MTNTHIDKEAREAILELVDILEDRRMSEGGNILTRVLTSTTSKRIRDIFIQSPLPAEGESSPKPEPCYICKGDPTARQVCSRCKPEAGEERVKYRWFRDRDCHTRVWRFDGDGYGRYTQRGIDGIVGDVGGEPSVYTLEQLVEKGWIEEFTTGPVETPEPRIGPGMILERGRERIVVYEREGDDYRFGVCRKRWGAWSINPSEDDSACDAWFRYLLLSGFRMIREADPTHPKGE